MPVRTHFQLRSLGTATQQTLAFHVSKEGDANILLFGSKTNPTEGYLGTLREDQSLPRGKRAAELWSFPELPRHSPGEAPGFGGAGSTTPPAEAAPEDVKESIQTVSCCLPPQLHPLLPGRATLCFKTCSQSRQLPCPGSPLEAAGFYSHGRARAPAAICLAALPSKRLQPDTCGLLPSPAHT